MNENKMLRFDDPNFKPRDLQESISWHEHALKLARVAAEEAGAKLYVYKARIVAGQLTSIKADEDSNRYRGYETETGAILPMARMVFLPSDDRELKRLEEDALFTNSEVSRLERKISEMRRLLAG